MKIPSKVYPYRLPYMGSKQNIAYSLMLTMLQKKPKAKYFFDIFGGGASMSLMAKQFGLKVFYTEKNGGIVNLLNFLKDNKIPKEWIKWIDREEFKKCLGKEDAYSVFVTVVWSFGNNRQAYLFGKDKSQAVIGFQISSAYFAFLIVPILFGILVQYISSLLLPLFVLVFILIVLILYLRLHKIKMKQK